jgi:hypothetical protein
MDVIHILVALIAYLFLILTLARTEIANGARRARGVVWVVRIKTGRSAVQCRITEPAIACSIDTFEITGFAIFDTQLAISRKRRTVAFTLVAHKFGTASAGAPRVTGRRGVVPGHHLRAPHG